MNAEGMQSHIGKEKGVRRQSVMAEHSGWGLIKLVGMSQIWICGKDKSLTEDAELWVRKEGQTKMHI